MMGIAQVREDLGDVLQRVQAGWDAEKEEPVVQFHGWARMALPLTGFDIIEVKPPKVGESKPAAVVADVVVTTTGAPSLFLLKLPREWSEDRVGSVRARLESGCLLPDNRHCGRGCG